MPKNVHFELVAVTSSDGYIARFSGENIANWTSSEEKQRFIGCFEGIDWGIMGRVTHQQVFKIDRRRVIFSRSVLVPEWREPSHLWIDPNSISLEGMIAEMSQKHAVGRNLILGGTAVHDWFLSLDAIDSIQLAIEPIEFGNGVEFFTGSGGLEPLKYVQELGFALESSEQLNNQGTVWHKLRRQRS